MFSFAFLPLPATRAGTVVFPAAAAAALLLLLR